MRVAKVTAALVVVLAAAILAWSAVSTSTARISATTDASSAFGAATLSLAQPNSSQDLLFDTDGLYPGLEVEGCVEIVYNGSIPGSLRLHAEPAGGTGLDAFIDVQLDLSTTPGTCEAFATDRDVFSGRLKSLWQQHPDYADGIVIDNEVTPDTQVALRAIATLADTNQAQGRTTQFWITVEVRP